MSDNSRTGNLNRGIAEEASDTIESMSDFGTTDLDFEQTVVLRDWSAQDFANIYVRFRPHLISHARKFLREELQAEEVVQDAFLYLMTALPELDSELGVLRFLKWKTKMLCLDTLRSSTSGLNGSLVPLPDDIADEVRLEASLERADDAAIIRTALAKLNPRHREALIATLYEEKSHEEVAKQMGVEQNAFRQLLWRARSAFKVALIGEADLAGKTISDILSIAARKAAKESGKFVTGASLVTLVISALIFAGNSGQQLGTALSLPEIVNSDFRNFGPLLPQAVDSVSNHPKAPNLDETLEAGTVEQSSQDLVQVAKDIESRAVLVSSEKQIEDSSEIVAVYDPEEALFLARSEVQQSLNRDVVRELVNSEFASSQMAQIGTLLAVRLETKSGLFAQVFFSEDFSFDEFEIWLSFDFEGSALVAAPKSKAYSYDVSPVTGEHKVTLAGTDFLVGDVSGRFLNTVTDSTFLASAVIEVEIVLGRSGEILSSTLTLKEKI